MNLKTKLKSFYKGLIFNLSATNSSLYSAYYRHLYRPVPGSLDHFISEYSRLKPGLTVIQIGANDGIHNDLIHRYIKRDYWKGVLLEPLPDVFEKSLKPLYRNQHGIIPVNAALDYRDGDRPIYRVAFSNSRWATGLTSFNRKILESAVESGYIARQALKEGILLPDSTDKYITEEHVECITTSTLLSRYGITQIDWLQIDTEGFDFEIIKMFDIARNKPSVIVYENLHLSEMENDECRLYLSSYGYKVLVFGANTLAVRDVPEQLMSFFI